MTRNSIDSPSHYAEGRRYETIDVIEDWGLGFRLGNAVKYLSRAGRKDSSKTVEDLKKAIWYINREIEALEGTRSSYSVRRGVTYQDVLQDAAHEAANGSELLYEYGVPDDDVDNDLLQYWGWNCQSMDI